MRLMCVMKYRRLARRKGVALKLQLTRAALMKSSLFTYLLARYAHDSAYPLVINCLCVGSAGVAKPVSSKLLARAALAGGIIGGRAR